MQSKNTNCIFSKHWDTQTVFFSCFCLFVQQMLAKSLQQSLRKMSQHQQFYSYNKHRQQQHNFYRQHHQYYWAKIPKMQQQLPLPTYQVLRFLLLLVCYCCHSQASMEYSAKLTNCYNNQYGFNDQYMHNDSRAIKQHLLHDTSVAAGVHNTSSGSNFSRTATTNNKNIDQFTQPLANTGNIVKSKENVFNSNGAYLHQQQHTSLVSGWKCCCWNATTLDEIECRCEGEALTRVPQTLTIPLQRLTIASAGLPRLRTTGLKVYNASLLDIVLTDLKYLETIEDSAFASLKLLRTVYISHAPKLSYLSKDVFEGISDTIKIIRIINSGLTKIPDLIHLPATHILQMIDLDNNHITQIESKSINIKTDQLILANNDISYIDDSAFQGSQIAKLILKENHNLKEVHAKAFYGMSMQELDLSSTSLVRLPSAGLQDIEVLRIENTHTLKTIPSIYNFKNLQTAYLTHSFHCCAFKFPSRHDPRRHAERMKEIEKWQQQCYNKNAINNLVTENSDNKSKQSLFKIQALNKQNNVDAATENVSDNIDEDSSAWSTQTAAIDETIEKNDDGVTYSNRGLGSFPASGFGMYYVPKTKQQGSTSTSVTAGSSEQLRLLSNTNGILYSRLMRSEFAISQEELQNDSNTLPQAPHGDVEYIVEDDYLSDSMKEMFGKFHEPIDPDESQLDEYCGNFTFRKHDVECYPTPNALNPCEDVMGYQWLRTSVWIVVGLAVIGNVAVLVVILSIKAETPSVPRFLMCHLAFADLSLGLYLLLIAAIDAHSMGEYFNYAYDWQYGTGCKVAGFLTVFASHLSVFTLTVITIERWLAITHAMYLNHRIKIRPAAYIMVAGWIYSVVMSLLPLFGISNYSSTSICLPMENRDAFDTVYLVAIMGLNGLAFFIIAICYGQIYLSLGEETRHAHSNSRGEMSVAKKMALLVFTNFACWAPIAFFALTALAGYPLINVTKSKILLVFFYPLNSCADPYLYAILTSQYRQDLYTLLAKFGLCKQKALKYKNSISFPVTTNFTCSIQRGSLIPKTQQSVTPPESQTMLKCKEDFV